MTCDTLFQMYTQKVKHPMSISVMRSKLHQGTYSSAQFLADVQAIGSNCITFWTGKAGPGPQLVAAAHVLMKKVVLARDV